ncbi:hypothetical protein FRC09_003618 [Ceratobasidium sp. 395]|nr:hypothetical protein FRC09_003618 [Ceratobasidium sp. 395]
MSTAAAPTIPASASVTVVSLNIQLARSALILHFSAPSTSGPPVVRRCGSVGRDPVVPSSKVKYEPGYEHPCLPSIPSGTGAPLTMMYLGEAEHGRPGILGGYTGSPLPSLAPAPYSSRAMGTPSLASSILTSASTSPRSVSSTLHHSSYRFGDQPFSLTNSPPGQSKMGRVWKESVLEGGSSGPFPPSSAAYNSPYGALSYLPKTSSSSFDEYAPSRATDPEARQGEWTPPHGVRNSLSLPSFAQQNFAYESTPEDTSAGFQSYPPSDSQLEYDGGLVPVHPHFQRS